MDVIARMLTLAVAILIPIMLCSIIIGVLVIVSLWKIFKKAGKEGWEAIIPGYNVATLSEIAGFTPYLGFLVLGLLIPVISSIAYLLLIALHVVNCLKISEAFGKDVGFAIGMMFLPFIFYPMLAFDQEAKYNSDYKYKGVGFSNYTNGSSTTNNNNTFYAENMNNTQETQSEAQSKEPVQEQNPVESTNMVDTNVDPIQYNENNNSESNNNGQW